MNLEQVHRDIGRLEGQVTALQSKVDAMDAKLDEALKYINRSKGATYVGSATLSAGVAFLTAWLFR